MELQEKIHHDLKISIKEKNHAKTSALRVLIGEFQRQPKKELDDAEVLSIIRKLIKAESEMLAQTQTDESDFLTILKGYLPLQASEAEIKEWIIDNIDFSNYQNKLQTMRPIMAHFAGTADGKIVKRILENL